MPSLKKNDQTDERLFEVYYRQSTDPNTGQITQGLALYDVPGWSLSEMVPRKHLDANARIREQGDKRWYYAWQTGLFTAEDLEVYQRETGRELLRDNLPEHLKDWEPQRLCVFRGEVYSEQDFRSRFPKAIDPK